MDASLLIPLVAIFGSVAIICGTLASLVLSQNAPALRRLRGLDVRKASTLALETSPLIDTPNPSLKRLAALVPKSPKEMGRIQRRLATAGYRHFGTTVAYSLAEIALPLAAAGLVVWWRGFTRGWV